MKRLMVSVTLALAATALSIPEVYAAPREEIRLTTIIPDQQVLRVKKGIISTARYRQADFPDNNIPANSLIVAEGRVGIGTTNPSTRLHIDNGASAGAIRITDGTQGAGKVLTSDNNGLASWANQTGGAFGSCGLIRSVTTSVSNNDITSTVATTDGFIICYMQQLDNHWAENYVIGYADNKTGTFTERAAASVGRTNEFLHTYDSWIMPVGSGESYKATFTGNGDGRRVQRKYYWIPSGS